MHKNSVIWLTEQDLNRLRHLIVDLTRAARGAQAGVDTLEEILDLGRVVAVVDIPPDVVTMNSRVVFDDMDSGERRDVTIVYPDQADPVNGKVSILSPVGVALLGLTEGAETTLQLPRGRTARLRIAKVAYQPEASGEYSL
ncbi:MAG: nucleoside diphosphate kinase regulator [Rhodospirillaceae bacterium]